MWFSQWIGDERWTLRNTGVDIEVAEIIARMTFIDDNDIRMNYSELVLKELSPVVRFIFPAIQHIP